MLWCDYGKAEPFRTVRRQSRYLSNMPFVLLEQSSLLAGITPVRIHYRDQGSGPPLIFLHGGWGYEMYPFDRQAKHLSQGYRCLMPDRSGYGRSMQLVDALPKDFHYRAAEETLTFMDTLGIEKAAFWGHSDGAVIAAILGFTAPERVSALILEAFHFFAQKISSREFFVALANNPESLGAELCLHFERDFGGDYWRQLITTHAKAWIELALAANGPQDDLYSGRIREISAPTLFIHGRLDPRTEPGELDAVHRLLPHAEFHVLERGAHSPHTEVAVSSEVTELAGHFLRAQS